MRNSPAITRNRYCRVFFIGKTLAETPDTVKVRVWQHNGKHYVLKRLGDCWESMAGFRLKKKALVFGNQDEELEEIGAGSEKT